MTLKKDLQYISIYIISSSLLFSLASGIVLYMGVNFGLISVNLQGPVPGYTVFLVPLLLFIVILVLGAFFTASPIRKNSGTNAS